MISEVLKAAAEEFFNPETGSAYAALIGDDSDEFVNGQCTGYSDAYQILLGLADHFSLEEAVNKLG